MSPIRLGMLTPSSNTVLEPFTARILHGLPDISAHFARFRVTQIALSEEADAQFALEPILAAARLLADAHCHVIAWNGTAAAWRGFETDEALCRAITAETGIPATSAVLGLNDALRCLGATGIGLVTPYTADVGARIERNYASFVPVAASRHFEDPGNFSFARFREAEIADALRAVAAARPDAARPDAPRPDVLATLCTNLRSPALAAAIEAETGLPVLDSIATTLWSSLRLAGADPARVQGWGRLFALG